MADDVDLAFEREEAHRIKSLRKVLMEKFDTGIAGVCEDCGEEMPRLVGGRCGFCRDGRQRK
jgi:hypothetical protein